MTGVWVTNDTISSTRMNEKTVFQGTGSAISGLTTYSGMLAFCTSSGSGFTKDVLYERNTADSAWNAVALDQLPYLKLSTTIGDYSAPVAAVATSSHAETASFSDAYTTNSGWTDTGTKVTVDSGVADKVAWASIDGDDEERTTKSLGLTLSDSQWTADFEFKHTAISSGENLYLGFMVSDASFRNGSVDGLGFGLADNGNIIMVAKDGASLTSNYPGTLAPIIDTWYYARLERTTTTNLRLSIYTDEAHTTLLGTAENFTIPSTITSLAVATHQTWNTTLTARTLTAQGDNLRVHNSTNTVPLYFPGLIYDNSTSTQWRSTSEANPAVYVDLTSAREIVGVALNIDTTNTSVTAVKIRASTDTSFADAENIAYVNISDFTDDTWRFLANNFLVDNRRYVQVIGTDTGTLAINEIKVRYGITDLIKILTHKHNTRTVDSASAFVDSN